MDFDVNYLAVLAGAVINMVVGFIYYSPLLFGKKWMSLVGFSEKEMKEAGQGASRMYALTTLGALVSAFVLANFVQIAGAITFLEGAVLGFWAWFGFVATTSLANAIFSKKPMSLYLLDNGYHLITFALVGGLLAVWQ